MSEEKTSSKMATVINRRVAGKHGSRIARYIVMTVLCAMLASGWILAGCSNTATQSTASIEDVSNPCIEQSATEIGTYERLDPTKTQLVIGVCGSTDITSFVTGFEAAYPDVQPIVVYLQIGNTSYSPASEWVRHGYAPDIVFNLRMGDDQGMYQVDLTDSTAAATYERSSLDPLSVDGRIYCLPGPSKVMGIAYNKTLFERYGWQVPTTFDEFVGLCDRISADTGGTVVPYNPNAKYALDYVAGLEGFTYGALFSGVENTAWYEGVTNNGNLPAQHLDPFFAMTQQLIDHGVIATDSFDYSYTTRNKEFLSGDIAMVNIYVDEDLTNQNGYEFSFMPFPSTDGKGGYLVMRSNYTICETVRDRSVAQEAAAAEFLDYISTPEAQSAYSSPNFSISHVNGAESDMSRLDPDISDALSQGRVFELIDFSGTAIPSAFSMSDQIRSTTKHMAEGNATVATACGEVDAALASAISDPESLISPSETIATVESDFSVLQTSEYIADMFRDITGAQIALIPDNSIYRGNIHRMFSGDLTANAITNMLPRSFDNGSKLVKVEMTGQQLLDALDDPPDYGDGTADCVYAFSGLIATVAPCNDPGEKYLSITLADGTAIDPDEVYTVAFWQGMVRDSYITDTISTYDGGYTDLLTAKAKQDGTLVPPDDGRIALEWG